MPIIDTVYPPTHIHTPQTHTHREREPTVLQQFPSALWATLWRGMGGLENETESKNKQSSGYERLFQNSFVILWQANENFPNYVQARRGGQQRRGAWQSVVSPRQQHFVRKIRFELSFSSLSLSLSVLLPHHLWSSANADEVFPRRLSTSPFTLVPFLYQEVLPATWILWKSQPRQGNPIIVSLSHSLPYIPLPICNPNAIPIDFESEASRGNPCWHIPYCRKNMT